MKTYTQEYKNKVVEKVLQCDLYSERSPKAAISKISKEEGIAHPTIFRWLMISKKAAQEAQQAQETPETQEEQSADPRANTKTLTVYEYYKLINEIKALSENNTNLKKSNIILIENNSNLLKENKDLNSTFRSYQAKVESYVQNISGIEKRLEETQKLLERSKEAMDTFDSQLQEKNKIINTLKEDIIFRDQAIIKFAIQMIENQTAKI